ncbi:S41 family peptidase [Arcicella aquatica]|uniref:Tricorn protease homolog n=1 Tax=Arcicella aquatica TaxID=217141 RepID=A0ABU5QS59_9BACT|nr:S41 family peptidase [Arcicella aquatica]MEA5259932.1 S41 family peptidase [Arcicella aquatica]
MKKHFLLLFSLLSAGSTIAQSPLLLRQPSINNDGSVVSFSYQGDIWTVPSSGGNATRLTIHEAYENNPIFSPDGKQIAFSGTRFGNNDIFVIPATGGLPKRLTYHSSQDVVASWTQSDKILFSTSREFKQIERPQEVYTISPKGGTESRLLEAVGFDPVLSPDGKLVAFVRGDINPVARQAYNGSSNRDIWMYNTKNKSFNKITLFDTNDIIPQWGKNGLLYFLSSVDGAYNLYQIKISDEGKAIGAPKKLTQFKDESIRHFSISNDGNTIVFEKEMALFTYKIANGAIDKINVIINADERFDASEQKTLATGLDNYKVSPNGKLLAYSIRGEIFIKEADKEKTKSINVSKHAFRDVSPAWLNDSTLLFTSDRNNGNFDLYLVNSADGAEHNIFKSLKHQIVQLTKTPEDETSPTVSPDNKKIAYVRGRGNFIVADISADGKLTNEKILSEGWNNPSDIAWSPDSKYIAYSQSDLYYNQEVYIRTADNSSKPVNVSMHPRGDSNPFWSADGSKLGFVSERSAGRSADVWFVWLKKEDWEKETQDWQEKETPAPDAKPEKKSVKPIVIDFDNIHERVVQVTNFPGDENDFVISKDGETFFYTTSTSSAKGRDLYSVKWDGKELKEITKGGSNPNNLTLDKEGKYIYYTKMGGSLSRVDVKTGMSEPMPFAAKMKIDYLAERTQVFEEAWRTIRDGFYDPKFHGNNWVQLHDKYKERCINASTSNDFRDMFNLLLGELNSSHMGLTAPDRAETQRELTGLLGTELIPTPTGMKVNHVVPETPVTKIKSVINEGETITAINGQQVSENENFYSLLNGLANEKVIVSVVDAAGKSREVVVRLTQSISDNLYNEWVEGRKKLVEKFSNGRLGYIHIKSMDFPSFEVVEREFTAAGYGKEGILIDVRYNGGGSTTDYLMTILNYKQHAYTIPRGASNDLEKDKKKFRDYYPIGERLVYAAWTKPSIALCNEGSYSNAEIFSHAYKSLGIGKLVGLPTNGSVISTGGKSLMDGSFVRLPGRGWYTKTTDKNQELGAAIPDVIVENTPDWIAKGTDEQLKVAVETLLKDIDAKK